MNGWLLDVGCGSGAILAKAKAAGFTPVGVDFNGPLLSWLKGHGYDVIECDLNVDRLPDAGMEPVKTTVVETLDGKREEIPIEAPRRRDTPKGPPIAPNSPSRRASAVGKSESAREILKDIAPEGYRCVVSCDTIEHLIDPDHMLAEVYRVMAPGAHFYCSTPNAAYWQRVQQLAGGEMFRTSGDNVLRDGGHLSYWAEKDLGAALKRAGFREVGFRYHDGTKAPASLRRGPWSDGAHMLAWAVK